MTLLKCVRNLSKVSSIQRLVRSGHTASQHKSFQEIPGPLSLPYLGTAWKYFPIIGEFDASHMDRISDSLHYRYGNLAREIVGEQKILHLFDPNDFEKVYKVCGNYQHQRPSFLYLAQYRDARPHLYKSSGILALNDERWWPLRKVSQRPISPVKVTRTFLSHADEIIKDFVAIFEHKQHVDDYIFWGYRLNMELTCKALFNERLNCFKGEALSKDSYLSKVINGSVTFAEDTGKVDRAAFAWTQPTQADYEAIEKEIELVEKFAIESIENVKNRKDLSQDDCIVAQFLNDPDLDDKEILGIVMDLLFGGVDTTSIMTSFTLYNICIDERIQVTLREEVRNLLPQGRDSQLSEDTLDRAKYTKAIIKESLRLNPIVIGQLRILPDSLVLSGFHIPKGSMVVIQNYTACRQANNFKEPLLFKPERWLKESTEFEQCHPYVMLPFGLGNRTCIARRRAEQNMMVLILRLFSEFEIQWRGKDKIGFTTPFLLKPDQPVKLSFKKL